MEGFLRRIIQHINERATKTDEITFSELNELLPSDKISAEQIELILEKLGKMGIAVVDGR